MNKILVANRGEIALRVMRTAREMGIKTVAVYSEADRNAIHTRFADEAYFIGPPQSNQSYLLMDKILEVAKMSGADAIHPGYGFLSENAVFAEKVAAAGIKFIGPSAYSINMMGDKISAKQAAKNYHIPMVPGTDHAITDIAEAKAVAKKAGYPILIKASAGGGGKGMRVVNNEEELEEQMHRAMSEALSAFGNDAVFIEKFVTSPRHIEIQVLADDHGNVVYLFERECSIQRRHQKLVEEAPSAVVSPEMRKAMGESAVMVAKACNYSGAGTVEFLVDDQLNYYFLEMNTRLQVEHPVTEFITGLDLVREQILIAEGKALSFTQDDLRIHGHAIELRVTAEDPTNNFLPDIGKLITYRRPQGHGIRVDDGYEEGMDIPIYYDPLLAKLIVHAQTRELACKKMIRAIQDYQISGVATTLPFGTFVMQHEAFLSGNFDTKFIERYFTPEALQLHDEEASAIAAFLAARLMESEKSAETQSAIATQTTKSKWLERKRM
ncbi:MAG TPA: acetyl-CoA carboxylase biotin carboxylase subunit [Chitinophagales bacterium]|nr:acetyl-CoA carboxylase biotin carboxylase subunit [Chitinophagales bacterium]HNE45923.1 acetyl-CoA carboxylase biotin carboxylase subunit [Chitinophagales bacterium]HNF69450.1 acetyl-CoA carboxylase biotin carboxylase subunit [Chitinophagales bacterium]HNI54802.1 acetyl-CoA carboxylase biotin carboxylase subunit [Chitinophagales bacterium]HNK97610.1 acetyl-CoA carboxylase biotin carboxylase subunit [Chitinophagales bacterium]